MVRIGSILKLAGRQYSLTFIDTLRIHVRGGAGGAGILQHGGTGGRGGNVYVVGAKDPELSLKSLKQKFPEKRFSAEAGESSSRRALSGLRGRSIYVQIPYGVNICDGDTGQLLGTVDKAGDRILVARGGKGGDRFNNFRSQKGETKSIILDLRLIADVGFVGFPNAGKSTLLNSISRATPEVADYPFTTLRPHIGIVEYRDRRKISCADLPGLIEGSHLNLGMGHKFLKHIERTKVLLFMVDLFGFSLFADKYPRDAFENIQLLTKELELYNRELLNRPAILVFNKIDKPGASEKYETVLSKLSSVKKHLNTLPNGMIPKRQMKFCRTLCISAREGRSVDDLKTTLREVIDETSQVTTDLLPDGRNSVVNIYDHEDAHEVRSVESPIIL